MLQNTHNAIGFLNSSIQGVVEWHNMNIKRYKNKCKVWLYSSNLFLTAINDRN
jgi:hypothetical protein